MTRDQAVAALHLIVKAVEDTVNEAGPLGAPAGVMYAAFTARGMSLDTFNQVTAAMVSAGRIARRGDVFYPV